MNKQLSVQRYYSDHHKIPRLKAISLFVLEHPQCFILMISFMIYWTVCITWLRAELPYNNFDWWKVSAFLWVTSVILFSWRTKPLFTILWFLIFSRTLLGFFQPLSYPILICILLSPLGMVEPPFRQLSHGSQLFPPLILHQAVWKGEVVQVLCLKHRTTVCRSFSFYHSRPWLLTVKYNWYGPEANFQLSPHFSLLLLLLKRIPTFVRRQRERLKVIILVTFKLRQCYWVYH